MAQIRPGKWTHDHDGEIVVFLVGMRVNKPSRLRTWWPTFASFPKMLRELYAQPELGFLGASTTINGRGALAVTYWKDLPSLIAYAHDTEHVHRPAWATFNRLARSAEGVVGIWHETFVVPARGHESLYVDMPVSGIVAATTPMQVTSRRDTAQARMARAG